MKSTRKTNKKTKKLSQHSGSFFNSTRNNTDHLNPRNEQQLRFISAPSPYYTNKTITPFFIVLHCIGFDNPLEILEQNKVSCHYLVPIQNSEESLYVYEVVKPPLRAWHAGVSQWKGYKNLNDYAIGIEINMPDYAHAIDGQSLDFLYFQNYQTRQITALQILIKQIQQEYNIPPENIIGHSDIAPWRNNSGVIELGKTDPGPTLPWQQLATMNEGILPSDQCDFSEELSAEQAQKLLNEAGYNVPLSGLFDSQTNYTIGAARLHWAPDCFNGSSGLANDCYTKPFDKQLACTLRNLSPVRNQDNAPLIAFWTTLLVGAPLLVLVVVCLIYKIHQRVSKSRYNQIPDPDNQNPRPRL